MEARDRILAAASWQGVTAADGELAYAGRPFARVLADHVELVLPPRVRDMLVEIGRAEAGTGVAVRRVETEADVAEAVELLRLAYERARVARIVRDARRG